MLPRSAVRWLSARRKIVNSATRRTYSISLCSRTALRSPQKPMLSAQTDDSCKTYQGPVLSLTSVGCLGNSCSWQQRLYSNGPKSTEEINNVPELKLMDIPRRLFFSPVLRLRNFFFTILINGYYDPSFTQTRFLQGVTQAITHVSGLLSAGNFDELKDLVSADAVQEIKENYKKLTRKQIHCLALHDEDFVKSFIHEIGMIFDDNTGRRFVEIMVVFAAVRIPDRDPNENSFSGLLDKMYICNYRLIREFTKGHDGSWVINQLNHFRVRDHLQKGNNSFF